MKIEQLLDAMFEAYESTPTQGHESIKAALRAAATYGQRYVLAKLPEKREDSMFDTDEYQDGWNDCLTSIEIIEINNET